MVDFRGVPLGDYLSGIAWFAVIAGGPCFAAWRITRARLGWMEPEARLIARCVLALAGIVLACLLPLALGILSRTTAALVSVVLTALVAVATRSAPAAPARGPRPAWGFAALMIAAAVAYALAFERDAALRPPADADSTTFILPTLFTWVGSGTMWEASDFYTGWTFGAYPNTGGMLQLAVLLPWEADFGLRYVGLVLIVLCGLATWALARELGAAHPFAAGAGVLGAMLPTALFSALSNAQVDALAAFGITAATLFAVRHARTGRRTELVLAVLAAGLAFGTKWYGPPEIAALLAVWTVALLVARRPAPRVLRDVVLVGAGITAVGGIWLVRNTVLFDNPLFPSSIGPLGIEEPPGFEGTPVSSSLLDYADDPSLLADPIFDQLVLSFALAGGLAIAGALATLAFARRLPDRRAAAVAAGGLAALGVYVALPYTAQGPEGQPDVVLAGTRYGVPGMLLAFAATGAALSRAPRAVRFAGGALAAVALAHEFDRFAAYPGIAIGRSAVAQDIVATAALAVAVRFLSRRRPPRPAVLAAALACLALVVVAGGRKVQETYMADRYRLNPAAEFFATTARDGKRVGLTGITGRNNSINAATFGPRLGNRVRYIGRREHGLLLRERSATAFAATLRAARLDYLVVGTLEIGEFPELGWARDEGWVPIVSAAGYEIMRRE